MVRRWGAGHARVLFPDRRVADGPARGGKLGFGPVIAVLGDPCLGPARAFPARLVVAFAGGA